MSSTNHTTPENSKPDNNTHIYNNITFNKEYTLHKKTDIGPCMDVKGYNGHIYAIQRDNGGRMYVLSENLDVLFTFDGIGNARQIEIKNGIAAISARENGLWLIDVSKAQPKLLCHYRTIEFATGITMYKNLVLVSCRQYGVEIVDISNPKRPQYAGIIRIGEVQSACVYKDVLYAGVWGSMKVVAVDISDISNPKTITELPLTGRGDGVVVQNGILYASTGQHKRNIQNYIDENDPMFGMGNGIEIYDVSNTYAPKHIMWDFFGKAYSMSYDMWKPMICGDVLICNNSILGIYCYDTKSMKKLFRILPPYKEGKPDAVTGTDVYNSKLYVTTAFSGLYVFDEINFDDSYRYDADTVVNTKIPSFISSSSGDAKLTQVYKGSFPVISVCQIKNTDFIALACGESGIHILNAKTLKFVTCYSDNDFCYDIKGYENLICGAFGESGIKIFDFNGEKLTHICTKSFENSVQQISLSKKGNFAVITCGGSNIKLIDLQNPSKPEAINEYTGKAGLLYGENFLSHSANNADISLFWHRIGLIYTNPEKRDFEFHNTSYPIKNGIIGYCPGNGCDIYENNILYQQNNGYVILSENKYIDDLTEYRCTNNINGKLCVVNKYLIATERAEGEITVTDISDIQNPVSHSHIYTNASPSMATNTSGGILLAGRYGGLLKLTF